MSRSIWPSRRTRRAARRPAAASAVELGLAELLPDADHRVRGDHAPRRSRRSRRRRSRSYKASAIAFTRVNTFSRTIRLTVRDPVSGSRGPRRASRSAASAEVSPRCRRTSRPRWYPEGLRCRRCCRPSPSDDPTSVVAADDLRLNVGPRVLRLRDHGRARRARRPARPDPGRRGPRARPDHACARCARVRRRVPPAPAAAPPSRACWRGSRRRCRCRPTACS